MMKKPRKSIFVTAGVGGGRWTINGNQQEAHWRLRKLLYSLLKNISIGGFVS